VKRLGKQWVLVWIGALVLVSAVGHAATQAETRWPRQTLGHGADGIAFVDNRLCQQCHPQSFQDWLGSHHEQAMQPATKQTVLGDFHDVSFTHQEVTSRFFTREGKYFVNTEGPDGQMADFEISYTFGVEPLQQYLIPLPGGRLQSFPIAWDTQKKRWFDLYPQENAKPGEALHWTGLYQTWNAMCAECHSTNLQKNYDPKTNAYQTTWSAVNVSCQACHGPGERHVAWARAPSEAATYGDKGLVVNFTALDGPGQVEQCARCHARRHRVSVNDAHGRPLLDDFMPELLRQGLYYPDGQIHDEVYVYGSFLQSKMYHAGVRCTDCHQPHNLKLRAPGNTLCVQCHQAQPDKRFPTLSAKTYDAPTHHFHPADSAGAQCVNCHMPAKTYMVLDARRDHSIRVPRPDLSVTYDTPNACTGCHLGRTARWAADTLKTWYGGKTTPHYVDILVAGRAGRSEAVPALVRLAGTAEQPAIVRATALELLRQYGTAGAPALMTALQDSNALIRTTAVGAMDGFPSQARLAAVGPLLRDPIRAVRLEAARVLASVSNDSFASTQRADFEAALDEFTAVQWAMADTPGAHLNLAVLATQQGQPAVAEQAYRTALRLDPAFLPARFNLATLYNQTGRNADAEHVLREALHYAPTEGELYYSLGLLLAEEQRLDEGVEMLGKARELLPQRARIHYNYGLTLQHLNRRAEAEAALLAAHQLEPKDAKVLHALAIFYIQTQHWGSAATYAEQLVRLYPNAPEPRQMLDWIRQHQGR
jgi:predicted CXXCH cytochrome family protein